MSVRTSLGSFVLLVSQEVMHFLYPPNYTKLSPDQRENSSYNCLNLNSLFHATKILNFTICFSLGHLTKHLVCTHQNRNLMPLISLL